MLDQTISHYAPWTEDDDRAVCGHRMQESDVHRLQPTCPACVAQLAAEEVALRAPQPSLADDLFAWAVDLTRSYAATLQRDTHDDPLAAHREGDCDHGCPFCDEATVLQQELVHLFLARRPNEDRIDEITERLTAIGEAQRITDAARAAQDDEAVAS